MDVTPVDDISVNDIVLTQENLGLKQKCRNLTSDKGHLQIKIEELELKVEAIVKENNIFKEKLSQLDSDKERAYVRLEVTKGQLSNQTDLTEKERDEKNKIAAKSKAMDGELKDIKTKFENLKHEKDDNLIMFESTIQKRELEIKQLKDKLDSANMKTFNYSCDDCAFSSDTEEDLKNHMKSVHEALCQHCDSAFAGTTNLRIMFVESM